MKWPIQSIGANSKVNGEEMTFPRPTHLSCIIMRGQFTDHTCVTNGILK